VVSQEFDPPTKPHKIVGRFGETPIELESRLAQMRYNYAKLTRPDFLRPSRATAWEDFARYDAGSSCRNPNLVIPSVVEGSLTVRPERL